MPGELAIPSAALWSDPQVARAAFGQGLARAAESLSAMVGAEISAVEQRIQTLSLPEAAAVAGSPDQPTVGIYLALTGAVEAHVVLLFEPDDAERLIDLLLGGRAMSALERSALFQAALGEVGNVMGSSFANVLGDLIGAPLWSTPPTVQTDMARALVDGMLACASNDRDQVLVVVTQFAHRDVAERASVRGTFLVVPEIEGMSALFEALTRAG
jgi:chemotaxis protein CheY-P-specific phosphatase CheC